MSNNDAGYTGLRVFGLEVVTGFGDLQHGLGFRVHAEALLNWVCELNFTASLSPIGLGRKKPL